MTIEEFKSFQENIIARGKKHLSIFILYYDNNIMYWTAKEQAGVQYENIDPTGRSQPDGEMINYKLIKFNKKFNYFF